MIPVQLPVHLQTTCMLVNLCEFNTTQHSNSPNKQTKNIVEVPRKSWQYGIRTLCKYIEALMIHGGSHPSPCARMPFLTNIKIHLLWTVEMFLVCQRVECKWHSLSDLDQSSRQKGGGICSSQIRGITGISPRLWRYLTVTGTLCPTTSPSSSPRMGSSLSLIRFPSGWRWLRSMISALSGSSTGKELVSNILFQRFQVWGSRPC